MTQRNAIEKLIQSAIDGELPAEERARLEKHLASHPEDAARMREMQRHSGLIGEAVPVPSEAHLSGLKKRAERAAAPAAGWRIAASVALFAAGLGFGYVLPKHNPSAIGDIAVFAEHARAAHSLYVSEVMHPVEVAATEKDHLQTWLSNRLGAAIIAPQLGGTGFSLIGGRLLPAGDQASALFMYENANGDRLSLLATHGTSRGSQSFRFHEAKGYLTISWQDGPWQYSLVGALERDPMGLIARNIHEQLI